MAKRACAWSMVAFIALHGCAEGSDAPASDGPVSLGGEQAPTVGVAAGAGDSGVPAPMGTTAGGVGEPPASTTGFVPVTTGAPPSTTWPGASSGGLTTGSTGVTAMPGAGTSGSGGNPTSTTGAMADDAGTPTGMEGAEEVPSSDYCNPISDWDPEWSAWEEEVLKLTNERRAMGADCGSMGSFPAVDPLTMNPELRCAARVHSKDMADRDFTDHINPDGEAPNDRIARAGYPGSTWGENIAWGQRSPEEAVNWWMNSDAHCSNVMSGNYSEIGVGFFQGESTSQWSQELMWTQAFGSLGWGGRP